MDRLLFEEKICGILFKRRNVKSATKSHIS